MLGKPFQSEQEPDEAELREILASGIGYRAPRRRSIDGMDLV